MARILGSVWVPQPTDPDNACDVCKHGAGQGVGPFWQGPRRPTGRPGFGRKQMGRLHICKECLFVIVNHPESPFHGLIPKGLAAAEKVERADAHIARLQERVAELHAAAPASPEAIAEVAVAAAIAELEGRGAFDKAPAPKPPARKQAAKPKDG